MHGAKKILAPVFILSILISAAGCNLLSPISKPKKTQNAEPAKVEVSGTLIAKVNNRPITLEELNAEVETFNSYVPQDKPDEKIDTRDKKVAYLRNEMIRKSLLSQAAKDRGLERKEDVRKAMDAFMDNLLVGELIREETAKIEVTSKEIGRAHV